MRPGRPRCLILVPTRELAAQVEASVQKYGKHVGLTSMVMFGGVNINPQYKALKGRLDILVATPGRLLDHVGQKTVDLSGVEILVLDRSRSHAGYGLHSRHPQDSRAAAQAAAKPFVLRHFLG